MKRVCSQCGDDLSRAPMILEDGRNLCFKCTYKRDYARHLESNKGTGAYRENLRATPNPYNKEAWDSIYRERSINENLDRAILVGFSCILFGLYFASLIQWRILLFIPALGVLTIIYALFYKLVLYTREPKEKFHRVTPMLIRDRSTSRSPEVVFDFEGDTMAYSDIYPEDWNIRRASCYRRDHYVCQICGRSNEIFHAHHLVPIHNSGNHNLQNLITLCEFCHLNRNLYFDHRRLVSRHVQMTKR